MKVMCAIFAAVVLILGVNVHAEESSTEIDKTLISSVDAIFNAIFNASATLSSTQSSTPTGLGAQLCESIYSVQQIQILNVGGIQVRECVHVTGWELEEYFLTHGIAGIRSEFETEMQKCSTDSSSEVLDCCVDLLSGILEQVSEYATGYYSGNKVCMKKALLNMVEQLDTASNQLTQCLSKASAN